MLAAAVRRTLSVGPAAARLVTYSEVASGRTPVGPYVTNVSPLFDVALVEPTAPGMTLTLVAVVPPPPVSVGAVPRKMFATPLPGAAPRFVPRKNNEPPWFL